MAVDPVREVCKRTQQQRPFKNAIEYARATSRGDLEEGSDRGIRGGRFCVELEMMREGSREVCEKCRNLRIFSNNNDRHTAPSPPPGRNETVSLKGEYQTLFLIDSLILVSRPRHHFAPH